MRNISLPGCYYPLSRYRSYPNRLPPFVHDYFLSSPQLRQAAASSESKSSARFSYRLNVQATVSLHTLWTGLTVSQIHKSTVYILVHPDIVRSVSASTSTLRFAGSPASSEPYWGKITIFHLKRSRSVRRS